MVGNDNRVPRLPRVLEMGPSVPSFSCEPDTQVRSYARRGDGCSWITCGHPLRAHLPDELDGRRAVPAIVLTTALTAPLLIADPSRGDGCAVGDNNAVASIGWSAVRPVALVAWASVRGVGIRASDDAAPARLDGRLSTVCDRARKCFAGRVFRRLAKFALRFSSSPNLARADRRATVALFAPMLSTLLMTTW